MFCNIANLCFQMRTTAPFKKTSNVVKIRHTSFTELNFVARTGHLATDKYDDQRPCDFRLVLYATMPERCVVYGCNATTVPHKISLFNFPFQTACKRRWVKFVKRTRKWAGPSLRSKICSQHFEKGSFENWTSFSSEFSRRLLIKSDVVPTIYPEGTCKTLLNKSSDTRPTRTTVRKRLVRTVGKYV